MERVAEGAGSLTGEIESLRLEEIIVKIVTD